VFLHFDGFNLAEGLLVELQALQLGGDFLECGIQGLLLEVGLAQGLLHLAQLVVEVHRAGHLFQDLKETRLALHHQVLYLTLLDDLELRIAFEREASGLKQVEELFLPDVLAIDLVIFFVRLAVVALAHHQVVSLDWDAPLTVVQSHLHCVNMGIGQTLVPLGL